MGSSRKAFRGSAERERGVVGAAQQAEEQEVGNGDRHDHLERYVHHERHDGGAEGPELQAHEIHDEESLTRTGSDWSRST